MRYRPALDALAHGHSASFWLKDAALALDARDPLDALRDAEALRKLAHARCVDIGLPREAIDNAED